MNGCRPSPRWLLLGAFLWVFGAKLLAIDRFGSFIPYWDQWEAEAASLFHPLENGNLRAGHLLAAHNEHRILWTRLLGLAEYRLNGGIWDPLFQQTVNAGLHALALTLILAWLRRELPPDRFRPLVLFALLFALPFGAENTLLGFQSQFYFLLLFGAAAIRGLTAAPPLAPRWWLGALALGAAFFSVASGFLAAPAVAAVYVFQMLRDRRLVPRQLCALALLLGYAVVAWRFTPVVAGHAGYQAAGPLDFARTLAKALAFPFCETPLLALFMQGPLLVLGYRLLRPGAGRAQAAPPWFLAGAAFWVWLNAAATAFGRGAGAPAPESRYMDTLFIGVLLNAAATLHVSATGCPRGLKTAGRIWLAVAAIGLAGVFWIRTRPVVVWSSQLRKIEEAHTLQFMQDGDLARLAALPFNAIPHPSGERLAVLLENKTVRALLPTPLRDALPAVKTNVWCFLERGAAPDVPTRPFETVWGSYGPGGPAWTGELALDFAPPHNGGFLEIAVAGQPSAAGLALRLETPDGRLLADLAPRRVPEGKWRSVYVRSPSGAFRIVAADASPRHWLAFAVPKEIGPGTLLARATLRAGFAFLAAGIVLLAWAGRIAAQRDQPQCGPSGQ